MLHELRRDRARYAEVGGWFASPGFWIVAVHRFGTWAAELPLPLRLPMWLVYRVAHLPYLFFNVHLWAGARGTRIGAGFALIHPNNLYFAPGVQIGENCLFHHEVTLGMDHEFGIPTIGNNVIIFPGARLLGALTVGDNAMIGANCVVQRDVPEGTVVVPAANRMLPRGMSAWARKRTGELVDSGAPPS
jgi:serine O-acetyltransferase